MFPNLFPKVFLFAGMLTLSLSPVFAQADDTPVVGDTAAGAAVTGTAESAGMGGETGDTAGGEPGGDTGEQLNYYIDRSGDEPRFIQRLLWEEAELVMRYVVIVEHLKDDGSYGEVERVSVEQAFAEFSLIAGKYRYHLEVYDLLDELCFITEWHDFNIIRALQPELVSFSPQAFYLDEDVRWELTLRGQNLIPESEIYLVQGGAKIEPLSHTGEGVSSLLVFAGPSLIPGEYQIYVRNPGGLDTLLGTFAITNRKPFEFNISVGYAPTAPLYGYLFRDSGGLEAPFIDRFYPLGAAAWISFIPIKRTWGYLGAEVSASFSYLVHEKEHYTSKSFFLNTHLNVLYQKYFFKRFLAFNARVGAGASTLLNYHYEYDKGPSTEDKTEWYPSILAGVSLTVFFRKPFYINAGADFIQMFSPPADGIMSGFVRPFATVGVNL